MNSLAPIVVFTYNRLDHTRRTMDCLAKNILARESEVHVFSDGARDNKEHNNVNAVRQYIKTVRGFKKIVIHENDTNWGLAKSIIQGVSSVFESFDKIIVLEDDLETSPYFLHYMNDALNKYHPDQIWSVAGYAPDIIIPQSYNHTTYLAHRNCSWGWGTWKQNWETTDWDVVDFGKFFRDKFKRMDFNRGGNDLSMMLLKQQQGIINSWSIRFNYAGYKQGLPTVYPVKSLVRNIGVDGSGTNMKKSGKYKTSLQTNELDASSFCCTLDVNEEIELAFKKFYNASLYRSLINWFKINKYLKNEMPHSK